MSVAIRTEGIRDFQRYLDAAPDIATKSARIALNSVVRGLVKTTAPQAMRRQVAFPTGYLEESGRLTIDRPATNSDLQTSILGRDRPTSLARFAEGLNAPGQKQTRTVKITVRPGSSQPMERAFAVRLNAGADNVDNYNIGLAIRLKPGEVLYHRHLGNDVPEIFPNVFLLYGPSVDQVFTEVAGEITPDAVEAIETEFFRQFDLGEATS
jgi:hypothetical protein